MSGFISLLLGYQPRAVIGSCTCRSLIELCLIQQMFFVCFFKKKNLLHYPDRPTQCSRYPSVCRRCWNLTAPCWPCHSEAFVSIPAIITVELQQLEEEEVGVVEEEREGKCFSVSHVGNLGFKPPGGRERKDRFQFHICINFILHCINLRQRSSLLPARGPRPPSSCFSVRCYRRFC